MNKVDFNINVKDIPLPSKNQVKKMLVRRTYEHLVRVRWSIMAHLKPEKFSSKKRELYGFRSNLFPKQVDCDALKGFERDMWNLIKHVEFRHVNNTHQKNLSRHKKKIDECPHVLVPSDKTSNLYEVTQEEYDKLLVDEVTKTYKKSEFNKVNAINNKAKRVAESLNIQNRVMRTKEASCHFTLKDHKEGFHANPSVRLINPCNQDLSRVAQISLKRLIRHIKTKHQINLWENTQDALRWFESEVNFKCNLCNYVGANKESLNSHVEIVHNKKKDFKCNQCNYAASQCDTLQRHMVAVHDTEKHFSCSICDYVGLQCGALKTHLTTVHNNLNDFQCNECITHCECVHNPAKFHCSKCDLATHEAPAPNTKLEKTFIQLDVCSMYGSINEDLLKRSIEWSNTIEGGLSEDEIKAIYVSRESLLFKDKEQWVKTAGNFDVTMGSKDGAEVCELVDLFLIHHITVVHKILPKSDFGTFRDDYIGITGNNKSTNERTKKKLIKVFQDFGLKITIEMNKTSINFLDVTMNLEDGSYKPFAKLNSHIRYVHSKSDHWSLILKQIPQGIESRLNAISSSEANFNNMKHRYQEALNEAGYKHTLKWHDKDVHQPENSSTKRKRKKSVIWYNPPFSRIIKTNIGKEYIRLIRKWFMSNPLLKSKFNTATMKVSYSACNNIKHYINGHNKKILKTTHENGSQHEACNCTRMECPRPGADIDSNCRQKDVVYQADIINSNTNTTKTYKGCTEQQLKNRVSFHRSCMRIENMKNFCELSKHAHQIVRRGHNYNVSWKILEKASSFKSGDTYCRLCTSEMFHILYNSDHKSLNDIRMMPCLHKRKSMLAAVT